MNHKRWKKGTVIETYSYRTGLEEIFIYIGANTLQDEHGNKVWFNEAVHPIMQSDIMIDIDRNKNHFCEQLEIFNIKEA